MTNYNGSLIINTREYGFFSSLIQIIDNLKYCENNNLKPIMNIGEKFLYQHLNKNPWGEFFENINDSIPIGNVIEITELTKNANFLIENYLMVSPSRHDYCLKLWNLLNNNEELQYHRNEINSMIKKYIIPNKEIKSEVQRYINLCGIGKNSLAVHMRTTDYGNHDISQYHRMIEKISINKKYDNIFVASDSEEAIMDIKYAYPNVHHYQTSRRAKELTRMVPLCHIVEGYDKINHGKDVLIECLLLSQCNEIVSINSNVAAMACYLNPNLGINLVARQHGGG